MNARERKSHVYEREAADHYVEPFSCSDGLFAAEKFDGDFIADPACGWGRIIKSATNAGYKAKASDIIDRRPEHCPSRDPALKAITVEFRKIDFLASQGEETRQWFNDCDFVTNPPFDKIQEFYFRAISLVDVGRKVAMIWPARRIAAATWLRDTPLQRIWYMNPRPSMPTGEFILAAQRGEKDPVTGKPLKVGGGTQDFCWLIHKKGYKGSAKVGWLMRDGNAKY